MLGSVILVSSKPKAAGEVLNRMKTTLQWDNLNAMCAHKSRTLNVKQQTFLFAEV